MVLLLVSFVAADDTSTPSNTTAAPDCAAGEYVLTAHVQLDQWPEDTMFRLLSIENETTVIFTGNGSLKDDNERFTKSACLDDTGCYAFEITDSSGDRFGHFTLTVDGVMPLTIGDQDILSPEESATIYYCSEALITDATIIEQGVAGTDFDSVRFAFRYVGAAAGATVEITAEDGELVYSNEYFWNDLLVVYNSTLYLDADYLGCYLLSVLVSSSAAFVEISVNDEIVASESWTPSGGSKIFYSPCNFTYSPTGMPVHSPTRMPVRWPTGMPTAAPTQNPTIDCGDDDTTAAVMAILMTDDYGYELSYELLDLTDDIVIASEDDLSSETLYKENECVSSGCYEFLLSDDVGDGLESGYFSLKYDDFYVSFGQQTFDGSSGAVMFCTRLFENDDDNYKTVKLVNDHADVDIIMTDLYEEEFVYSNMIRTPGYELLNYTWLINGDLCLNISISLLDENWWGLTTYSLELDGVEVVNSSSTFYGRNFSASFLMCEGGYNPDLTTPTGTQPGESGSADSGVRIGTFFGQMMLIVCIMLGIVVNVF